MKKKITWIVIAAMILSMFSLTGCGGGGGSDKGGSAPKHESQTFMLGDWEIKTTKDEVRFDAEAGCDNFLLYFTATNKADEMRIFSYTDNTHGYQNEDSLYWGGVTDENGDYIVSGYDVLDQEVEAGGTLELVYGWELVDDSAVTVVFQGFTTAVESTEVVYEMEGRLTEEWISLQEEEAAKLEELQSATSFDIEGVSGDFVDGWYAESSSEDDVKLVKEDIIGYIEVTVGWGDSAEEEANDIAGNFNMDPSSITVENIGGNEYYCLIVSDTMAELFIDSSDGVVNVGTMFISLEEALPQIEAFVIK